MVGLLDLDGIEVGELVDTKVGEDEVGFEVGLNEGLHDGIDFAVGFKVDGFDVVFNVGVAVGFKVEGFAVDSNVGVAIGDPVGIEVVGIEVSI